MVNAVAELHRKKIMANVFDDRTVERLGAMLAVEEMIIECIDDYDKYNEWSDNIVLEMGSFLRRIGE